MSCKDCIHYSVCGQVDIDVPCASFKDKSKFIELPCKVGDRYYLIEKCYTWGGKCHCTVEEHTFRSLEEIVKYSDYIKSHHHIFLNKDEAEKALKECESK